MKSRPKDNRDYARDAKKLVDKLNLNHKYEMYEIVTGKLKYSYHLDEKRVKELEAIRDAIENTYNIDEPRLLGIKKGLGEMAEHAKPQENIMTAEILQFTNHWNPYTFDQFTITWENLGLSYEGTLQISLALEFYQQIK